MNSLAPLSSSPRLVPACADAAGIERLAYQLFCQAGEEGRRSSRAATRLAAAALDRQRLQEATRHSPEQTPIPLAYQLWISHLLWLEDVLHTLECRPAELTAVELAGLQALARARSRFLRSHQFCPHCDAVNPRTRGAARCRRCQQEM
jgi:NADH pyrophosphatase NudC (nudix superfamily)